MHYTSGVARGWKGRAALCGKIWEEKNKAGKKKIVKNLWGNRQKKPWGGGRHPGYATALYTLHYTLYIMQYKFQYPAV